MTSTIRRIGTATLASALLTGLAVAPAVAKDGDGRIITRGDCSTSADWKLKAKPDDGRLEVEFEVDQNRNNVPWKVTLRRNGALVATLTARTRAPSGSFSVRRVVARAKATDRIVAVATRSGEQCKAQASL